MELPDLKRLPLANLEQLTIRKGLLREDAGGLAALQQLHAGGRLALLLGERGDSCVPRHLRSDGRRFSFRYTGDCTPALLRLVLEAGQGISALELDLDGPTLSQLEDELLPLLQQHGGRVDTLRLYFEDDALRLPQGHAEEPYDVMEEWCSVLLGLMPACITHVEVVTWGNSALVRRYARALVRGGLDELAHPLHLTLVDESCWRGGGGINTELEDELRELVEESGGDADGDSEQLLTLQVDRC